MPRQAPNSRSTEQGPWHPRDPAYSCPLPLPVRTAYHELDIEPDSSDREVGWAKHAKTDRLKARQVEVERKLEAVYRSVEGLREAYDKLCDLRRQGERADERDLKAAGLRLRQLEGAARKVDPEFGKKRLQVSEIEMRIRELNSMALDNPDKRREYDCTHPPLALLNLADCTRLPLADDPRTTLFLLRVELAKFLRARSGVAFHPSDLTRRDFSRDFTRNDLLDGSRRG